MEHPNLSFRPRPPDRRERENPFAPQTPAYSAPPGEPSAGRQTARYDYSQTICFEVDGQIIEYRRLNPYPGTKRTDCFPTKDELGHLQYRAGLLKHTIVFESHERLDVLRAKFGTVPGIIFISDGGTLVSRGQRRLVSGARYEITRPNDERLKMEAMLELCNLGHMSEREMPRIMGFEFLDRTISDSAYAGRVASVCSF